MFQSTHPRGVRPFIQLIKLSSFSRFNPRTREGCDEDFEDDGVVIMMFQSTHPRGVRLPKNGNI